MFGMCPPDGVQFSKKVPSVIGILTMTDHELFLVGPFPDAIVASFEPADAIWGVVLQPPHKVPVALVEIELSMRPLWKLPLDE